MSFVEVQHFAISLRLFAVFGRKGPADENLRWLDENAYAGEEVLKRLHTEARQIGEAGTGYQLLCVICGWVGWGIVLDGILLVSDPKCSSLDRKIPEFQIHYRT